MAGLHWVAVVLAFFLSTGTSLADVDQSWLKSIVEGIKNEYALGDTFSLAVNVPQNQDPTDLQEVFQDDPADKLKQTVSLGQVYQGTRVVATSGALLDVLENIQPLIANSQDNFLVIYSEESPCGPTCTSNNEDTITERINDVIENWSGYAFVFSKVADVPATDTSQQAESFKELGISKLGLDHIFRCYQPGNDPFQCTSCSSDGDVTPSCVANEAMSNQEQGKQTGEVSEPRECDGSNCKRRGGSKYGEVKKGREQKKGGKVRKGGKGKKGGKVRKGRKGKKGGKVRKGGKGKKVGKVRKGGKFKKGGKVRKRGKGKKGGKGRKRRKYKKGGKGRKRG
ncbi:hypothetical protein E3U43_008169 [Scomber scombrus]|uniref:Uncharacterized protein n=1 Tax=Scomber scombrus TaxID=13677 RepID=A0AAV1PYR2_SCOSC